MKTGRGLKLGVIGAGVMGQNHIRIAAALSGIKLIGCFDPDSSRAEEASFRFETKSFLSLEDLLSEAEAVCVASPTSTHFPITKMALESGKHALIEKPFTADPFQAEALSRIAYEKGLVLSVGMIERFNPAFIKLLRLLKGEKIHGLDFKRFSPFPERVTDTNVVFDMMIHDLFLLLCLEAEEIDSIKADGKIIQSTALDEVNAVIAFKNGVIARLSSHRVFGSKTRNISATTDKHLIDCDLLNKRIYIRDFSSPSPSTLPIKPRDQLSAELENFLLAIRGKEPLLVSPADVIKSLKLAREVESKC
jgi:predicted dehydrogenase